jgi:hypothetical protein
VQVDPAVAGQLGGQLGTEAGVDEPAATPFDHGAERCNRFGCRPTGLHVVVSARRGQILTGGTRDKSTAAGTATGHHDQRGVDLDAIVATLEIEGFARSATRTASCWPASTPRSDEPPRRHSAPALDG